MNDYIFKEQAISDAKRLMICGFTDSYAEMLSSVLQGDFIICQDHPQLIIADEQAVINENEIPVIVLGKSESKRKNKVFISRPVSLSVLRQTALSLVSQNDVISKATPKLSLNSEDLTVSYRGKSVVLTSLEFHLFSLLYESGEPVSREKIRGALWPTSKDSNICDVYVCYLRKKLETLLGKGFIVSLRGKGYTLRLP